MTEGLPPCDPKIFKDGKVVFVSSEVPSEELERWVREIRESSALPVDWHTYAGRGLVRTLAPVDEVVKVMLEPDRELAYNEAYERAWGEHVTKGRPHLRALIERTAMSRRDDVWESDEYSRVLRLLRP